MTTMEPILKILDVKLLTHFGMTNELCTYMSWRIRHLIVITAPELCVENVHMPNRFTRVARRKVIIFRRQQTMNFYSTDLNIKFWPERMQALSDVVERLSMKAA